MKIRRGFTLIELLVVVSIIAILSAVGLASFQNARNKALDGSYKATVKSIQQAAEQAFNQTTNVYVAQATVATYLEAGWPTVGTYTYSLNATSTAYCVMSPVLKDATAGNCGTCANGVANIGSATTYFCAKNLQ